ncbi:MAG: bifunctional riboflavin kinase/FAD synthetase [Thermoleophilaceae bacterium]
MKVTSLRDIAELPVGEAPARKVAIGTFDGVHMGHREVIAGNDTVLTFEPHPLSVLRPEAQPQLVMPIAIKRDVIAGLGVEELVVIPFDRDFSLRSAEEFADRVLVSQLGATSVSVGQNFHFGRDAAGTPEFLRSRPEFESRVVPLIEVGGKPVSSSRIRALLAEGDVSAAAELLGGPFMLEGTVVHGEKRGRELGYPTANVVPAQGLVAPANGVYAAWANGYPAAVNVGVRPTFQSALGLLVEAYLIDFEGDLYGTTLRIAFAERLRGEQRFNSVEQLVEQMTRDVGDARMITAAAAP